MKNTLIKKGGIATAVLGFGLMLSACGGGGGGGGGGSPFSGVPSAYQGAYTGALQPGDFVSFYVSGNTLSYTVTGIFASQYCKQSPQPQPYASCVGGSLTGTLTLTQIPGLSNNYFEATIGNSATVYVFLSGSAGIFAVPTQSATLAFVGYKNTLSSGTSISQYLNNFRSIPSHIFIYAKYNYQSGSIDIYSLTVSSNYSYTYYDYNTNTPGGGCWAPDHDHNRIIAENMPNSNCSGVVTSPNYNIILTPAGGITVDYIKGTGIGVGVPALSSLPSGSYTISAADIGGFAGLATESLTVVIPSTGSTGSYTTLYTAVGWPSQTYTGSLTVGQDCNGVQVSGIISATNSAGECYDIFLDQVDNYYVAVRTWVKDPTTGQFLNNPYLVSIGAIQK